MRFITAFFKEMINNQLSEFCILDQIPLQRKGWDFQHSTRKGAQMDVICILK